MTAGKDAVHTGSVLVTGSDQRARRLVTASWGVALLVVAGLVAAVVDQLAHPAVASDSMDMHLSHALYRAGADRVLTQPLLSSALFTSWQLDSVAIAVVVLLSAGYLTAAALVPIRSGGERWPRARTALFLAGMTVCLLATNSSIAVYDQVLFSAHMLGHLALVMLGPALIVAGRPLRLLVSAARPPMRNRLTRMATGPVVSLLTAPPVALACYAAAIVATHLTGLMDTIMRVTWAGQLEHLVYVLVGCQFFSLIVGDEPIRWRLTSPARWLLLAIAMAVDTFTGVVLLQSTTAVAMMASPGFRVDALSDTRTGGAIMWIGGDAIMAAVMIVLVISWLYRPDQRRADQSGWAEQARRATFEENVGAAVGGAGTPEAFDDEDAARTAYNRWLAGLSSREGH